MVSWKDIGKYLSKINNIQSENRVTTLLYIEQVFHALIIKY